MCFASRGDFYLWSVAGAVGSEQRDLLAKEIMEVTSFLFSKLLLWISEAPPGSCWSHRGEVGQLGLLAAAEMLTSIPPCADLPLSGTGAQEQRAWRLNYSGPLVSGGAVG